MNFKLIANELRIAMCGKKMKKKNYSNAPASQRRTTGDFLDIIQLENYQEQDLLTGLDKS